MLKRILTKILLLSVLLTGLSACNGQGSGNIFDDPPDCYYDTLFGCGTFDIPWDSSYYGYDRIARLARAAALQSKNNSANFSGNWSGSLKRRSSTCKFATPLKVYGNFSVRQLNNRVTISLPSTALSSSPLKGQASSKGISASANGFVSLCSYRATTNIASSDTRRGTLNLALRISCPLISSCDLQYSGSAKR